MYIKNLVVIIIRENTTDFDAPIVNMHKENDDQAPFLTQSGSKKK